MIPDSRKIFQVLVCVEARERSDHTVKLEGKRNLKAATESDLGKMISLARDCGACFEGGLEDGSGTYEATSVE